VQKTRPGGFLVNEHRTPKPLLCQRMLGLNNRGKLLVVTSEDHLLAEGSQSQGMRKAYLAGFVENNKIERPAAIKCFETERRAGRGHSGELGLVDWFRNLSPQRLDLVLPRRVCNHIGRVGHFGLKISQTPNQALVRGRQQMFPAFVLGRNEVVPNAQTLLAQTGSNASRA